MKQLKSYFSLHGASLVALILILNLSGKIAVAADEAQLFDDSLQDVTIVVSTTLIGGILGLSTLSFVENPSEHLRRVLVGGAIGVIVGVATVAYIQAGKSKEIYYEQQAFNSPIFDTTDRLSWHKLEHSKYDQKIDGLQLGHIFTF